LPEHIWIDIPPENSRLADFNIKSPIGTGPYKIKSLKKDSRGYIKSYTLTRNQSFYNELPNIEDITFKFYPDYLTVVEALNNGNIDGINYLPKKYTAEITNKNVSVHSLLLPQYSAIFFNAQKNSLLDNLAIRQALTHATNRMEIADKVLNNQGEVLYGPILPGFIGYKSDVIKYNFDIDKAISLIKQQGWKQITADEYKTMTTSDNDDSTSEEVITEPIESIITQDFFWQKNDEILSITLTTVDNTETIEAATLIKKQWGKIGVQVNLAIIPENNLSDDVIKPRNYQAFLIGHIIGNDPDPYAFWHSSQINDPGVNLAMYKNTKVDSLLEEARKTSDNKERAQKYEEFQDLLKQDAPAIFLYNPTYPYVLHKKIQGFAENRISIPSDRFNGIENWYIKTKRKLEL